MPVAHSPSVPEELRAALPGRVETDPVRLLLYTTDRSGHRSAGAPIAAVHPRTVEDVQAVCRIASATATPVVTREAVLALKVVLADGRLLEVGHRTVKGVTGCDLCALMIGSEGTLGVVVEATLKLRPAVEGPVVTIGAFFDSVEAGAAAAAAITGAGHVAAIMELMDRPTLECVSAYTGEDLLARGGAYLLVQCDGPAAAVTAERITELVRTAGGTAETTVDPAETQRLIAFRRAAFPALEAMGTTLVEDIAVPRDAMAAAFARTRELEEEYGVVIPTTCHAGDGNLHPTFVFDGDTVPETVWAAAGELFSYALEAGGTLTGEHGVGLLKRDWLAQELGARPHRRPARP